MKKIGLVLFFVMLASMTLFGQYIEIGNQDVTIRYIPTYGYYDYSWTRTIYLQSELLQEMTINKISYNVSNEINSYEMNNQSIYIRHTDASTISSTDYIDPASDDSFQLVFSGNVVLETGWNDYFLDTTFDYNGNDNIEVVFINNDGSYNSGYPYFYGFNSDVNRTIYRYSDGSFPASSGTINRFVPNTRFHILDDSLPGVPYLVEPVMDAINVATHTEFMWNNGVNTSYVALYIADNDLFYDAHIVNPASAPYYYDTEYNTHYYWKIVAYSPQGESTTSQVYEFYSDYGIAELPFSENFDSYQEEDHPNGWIVLDNSGNSFNLCQIDYGQASSAPASMRLNNSGTTSGDYILSSPKIENAGNRVKFSLIGEDNFPIEVILGTMSDALDIATFTVLDTINVSNYFLDYSYNLPNNREEQHISFKHSMLSYYQIIYIDDFVVEEIPDNEASPVVNMSPQDGSIDIDLDASLSWELGVSTSGINLYLSEDIDQVINHNDSCKIVSNEMITSFQPLLEGYTDYYWCVGSLNIEGSEIFSNIYSFKTQIEPGVIIIDEGRENHNLPIEPFYGYTYSQSIYSQEQINYSGNIHSIAWHYNGNSAWGPDEIVIYMGHTSKETFSDANDWEDYANLQEVYSGLLSVSDDEAWITLELDNSFTYNNVDNLIIAVDENTPGYHGSSDDFYNTATPTVQSLVYYNDGTNPDPQGPPAGREKTAIPNVILRLTESNEISPSLPIVIAPEDNELNYELEYPLEWTNGENTDYVNLTIATSSDLSEGETYTNVQSPFFFEHQYNTSYYWQLEAFSSTGNSTQSQIYKYTTDYGIIQTPFTQNFDSYNQGDHPNGWYVLDNTGNSYNLCQVDYELALSAPASMRLHNSGTTSGDYILSSPRFETQGKRVKLSIIGQDNFPIEVVIGTMDNPNNVESFTAIDTISLSDEFENYTYSFSADYAVKNFSFKHSMLSQYQNIYIDDFIIEEIPENEPTVVNLISPEDQATNVSVNTLLEWEIGDNTTGINLYLSSNLQEVENLETSALVIANELVDFYECLELDNTTSYYWRVSSLNNISSLAVHSEIRQFTTELGGNLVSVNIGDEEVTNIGLPIEPYFGYSYSQTIYKQEQINSQGNIISVKIHYNGNSAWGPEDLNIYMGHTQLESFDSSTAWLSLNDLIQVYAGTITVTDQDQWLTFSLDTPFNYNNVDNLVIAWDENTHGYHSSGDEFFNSLADGNVSLLYKSDSTNPDPANPPSGTLKNTYPNIEIILDGEEVFDEYPPARNLSSVPANGLVNLTWSPPDLEHTEHNPLGYYVYRDTTRISATVVVDTVFTDNDIQHGESYEYYVIALYSYNQSQESNVQEVLAYNFTGEGNEESPYLIENLMDLRILSENQTLWSSSFEQTTDIDASDTQNWNEGAGFSPIGTQMQSSFRFNGYYFGDHHKILNLFIDRPETSNVGLFGVLFGTVKDLKIENASITGYSAVGTLAGNSVFSTISNIVSSGAVTGNSDIGSLVGSANQSTISNSYANTSVSGVYRLGGLISLLNASEINNCYANGSVSGTGSDIGGLVGRNFTSNITNSFWDTQTSGQTTSAGGTGLTTAEMQTLSTYLDAGWDFTNETANGDEDIWTFVANDYPHLAWEGYEQVLSYPPDNLQANLVDGTVELTWSPYQGLARSTRAFQGYKVFRDGIEISDSVIADTLYNDTTIEAGNTYSYYVTALYDEEESQPSNVVEIEIPDDCPAPTNLTAEVDYPNINLAWDEIIEASTEEVKWTDESWAYYTNSENTFAILAENNTDSAKQITTIGFMLYGTVSDNNIDVKVWSDNEGLPGNELYSLATTIDLIYPDWCNIDVSEQNWTIPANTNVFIGIANFDNSSSLGILMETTSSPAHSFTYQNEQWYSCQETYSCSNIALRAEVITNSQVSQSPDSYSVYRSDDNDSYYLIASVFEGNYQDITPIFNTQSYYYVTAVYGDIESLPSNIVAVEINELILQGQGTQEDPYLINDLEDLYILTVNNEYWGQGIYIEQTADIDAEASQYVQGSGFSPIGYEWGNFFRGNYNGNNHTISHFYVNLPESEYVGLFGYTYGATISNLNIQDIQVYGNEKVGGLVGRTYASTLIENCSVTGVVTGTEGSNTMVGGLVGNNYESTINNCYTETVVNGTYIVGGLVGYNIASNIDNSYALENINCSGHFVGGLVGYNQSESSIENSYALCNVHGVENVGGLVAFNDGSYISKSYSQGQVSSIGAYTGGLVAKNMAGSTISESYSTASVNGAGSYGGGLVADNNGSISDSYASGDVECLDDYVGGLVGLSSETGQITNCYSTGNVSGTNSIGAFIGFNNGSTISNSTWNSDTCDIELGAGGNTGNLNNFTGLSNLEFLNQANFTNLGWDFLGEDTNGSQDIWTFSSGHYPYLTWEDKFVAEFTVSQQTISANSEVTFTNLSIGEIETYEWDFGDDSYSNEVNPSHTYYNPGTYSVKLTIYNEDTSDIEYKFDYITVYVTSPSGLTAYVEDNENDVILNWQEEDGIWLQKCNDTSYNGIGTNNEAEFSVAIRYTQEELSAYQGMYLSSIKMFPRVEEATYTLKVWGGANGMDELYSQNIASFENEQWNEFVLDSTIPIPSSGHFYVGYKIDTPLGLPAGADNGPVVEGGNMIRFSDSSDWSYLHNLNSSLTVNFNIKAFLTRQGQDRIVQDYQPQIELSKHNNNSRQALVAMYNEPNQNSTDYLRATRDLTAYKVYRDDSMIVTLEPETTTYVDYDLPNGSYEYYVTQVYGAVDSNPSNRVNVDVHQVLVDFEASSLEDIAGQEIQFNNLSTEGDFTYYWDFGDGNFSYETNPLHIYNQAGTYSVSLTLYEGDDSYTELKEDYINVFYEMILLTEDFEDNSLDNLIRIETVGTFNYAPGIKSITNFGSQKAYGFGRSTRSSSAFDNYVTKFIIDFNNPTYVSEISFKEMELYGNWGSSGAIFVDGNQIQNTYIGRIPSNDHNSDSNYRTHNFVVNQEVTELMIKIRDITSSSEIFIDDLEVYVRSQSIIPNFYAEETSCDQMQELQFINQSVGYISSYLWDFGDGSSSVEENPYHVYQEAGNYTVSLTISNDNEQVTETKENYITVNAINNAPSISLPHSFTFAEDGHLMVDFANYVEDVDANDQLVLTQDNGQYITSIINGLVCTFSAQEDWNGSETLYFTVDDQFEQRIIRFDSRRNRASATDSVLVIVTPSDDPIYVQNPIDDMYEPMNSGLIQISMDNRFIDIDNEIVSFEVIGNSNPELIDASIDGNLLLLDIPDNTFGTALIGVRAYNDIDDNASFAFQVEIYPTPEISIAPESFEVSVMTGEDYPASFIVSNTGLGVLNWGLEEIVYNDDNQDWVNLIIDYGTIEVDGQQEVSLSFSAQSLSAGQYQADIIINHDNPHQDYIIIPVILNVLGLPEISLSTNSLNFGDVFVNSTETMPLVISNTGSSPLIISNIATSGNYYNVNYSNFTVPVNQSRSIEITFSPDAIGNDDGTLSINSNDYLHNPMTVSLFAEAIAPPEIEVIAQDLNFYVLGNGVDSKTILIQNNGASTLEFNIDSQESWINFNPFMGQLAAGEEQVVTLNVNPTNLLAGIYNTSFQITSNVPNSPANIIDLELIREVYNVTNFDNENNELEGVADNDLDELVSYNSNNGPIEFNIFSNNPNPQMVNLSIRAWNVDSSNGGVHTVSLNGYVLGTLRGLADAWTSTLFEVEPEYLSANLKNLVEIDVDSDFVGNSIKVDWGQLTYDNTSLNASIRSVILDQTSYYAGSILSITEEIDTNLSSQEVRVETTIYSPWDTIVTGTSRVLTITGNDSDAFIENLEIPDHYTPGVYEIQVIVYDNNSNIQQEMYSGNFQVKPYEAEILIRNTEIDFGAVLENQTAYQTLSITNIGHADLVITEISSNLENFSSDVNTASISYNQTQDIQIAFTPTSLGQVDANLTIMSNATNTPAYLVQLTGIGIANVPYIEVSHSEIDFGNVYTIVPSSVNISVSNVGPAPLNIASIISNNPYFLIDNDYSATELMTNESIDFMVTFQPDALEEYNGNITITSNADNQATYIINLTGQGSIAPQVTYNPTSYDIAMNVGQSLTETINIGNTGGNNLTWNIKDNFGKMFKTNGFNSETTDYGYIRNRAPIQLYGGSFCLEMWFRVDSNLGQNSNGSILDGGKQYIISKSTPSQNGSFAIYTDGISNQVSNKNLKVALNNGTYRDFLISDNIVLEEWNHIAVNYDEDVLSVYLNGNLQTQAEVLDFNGNYDPWILGKMGQTTASWYKFDGAMDEIRIWENSRSIEEIDNYRNVRMNGSEDNLVGYWNFDQADMRDASTYQTEGLIYGNATIIQSNVSTIPEWISFSNTSGELTPGSNSTLDIQINTSDILGGEYQQLIELSSNDPDESYLEIPLNILVTGIPELLVSSDNLDFGNSFIGYSDTLSLVISNPGTDILELNDFSFDNPVFSSQTNEMTIQAQQSARLVINFAPESETEYNANLTFTSNLPGNSIQSIALSGNGVYTPHIDLSQETFIATVNSGNLTNQDLIISNIQGQELVFNLRIQEASQRNVINGEFNNLPVSNKGMTWVDGYLYIVSYTQNKLFKYDISTESIIEEYVIHNSPFGITYDGNRLWIGSTNGSFYSYDLVGNQFDQFNNPLLATPALTWNGEYFLVSSSGTINPQIYTVDYDGNIIGSAINTNFNGKINQMVWVEEHEQGQIWTLDYSAQMIRQLNYESGQVVNYLEYDNFDDISYGLAHNGRDLWIAPDVMSNPQLFRIDDNMDEFNWLTLNPNSGTLLEGENQVITLQYDARNLNDGTYLANIIVESNDAENPYQELDVTLEVTGNPTILVSDDEIEFSTGYIGQTLSQEITISNTGTANLEITDITCDNSDFSVDANSFIIEPLTSEVLTVYFTPLSGGVKTGQLFIQSNASNNNEYIIDLTGIGEGQPTIQVNPSSLTANLTTDNEETQMLRITNTGGSDLIYSLELDESNSRVESFDNDYEIRDIAFYADESRNQLNNEMPLYDISSNQSSRFLGDQINTYPNMPTWNAGMYWLDNELYIVDFNKDNENQQTGLLHTYDLDSNQISESYPIHTEPYGITYDGTYLWIGNQAGNVYGYDPTTLNTSSNPPIASFSSPVDYFPAITYIGDSFLINVAFDDSPITEMYRVAHDGEVLQTYSAYLGNNISQLTWIEEYHNNELWAFQNLVEDDVIVGGKILQLQLANGTIIVQEEQVFWDNTVIYSFTSNGKDLWISDSAGPLFQLDDGRWLSSDTIAGTIAASDYQDIEITFDPTGIYGGDYSASLLLTTNDPDNLNTSIPISMRVQGYPAYEISTNMINFGEVAVAYSDEEIITLVNTGTDDLEIQEISFDPADVFSSQTAPTWLSPNEELDIVVDFSPTANTEFDALMTIQTSIGSESVNLNGQGYNPPIINLSLENIVSSLVYGNEEEFDLNISNTGDRDLTYDIRLTSSSREINTRNSSRAVADWLSANPLTGTIQSGMNESITINVSALNVYAGSYSAAIMIDSNDPRGSQEIPVNLSVSGSPQISYEVSEIDLGSVLIGNSSTETITISNTGSANLQVSSLTTSDQVFMVYPPSFTLAPEASRLVTVSFTPINQGTKNAELTIVSNSSDDDNVINLTGYGMEASAEIYASTSTLDFSTVNVGDSSEISFTIYNQGTGLLRITNIYSDHPDFLSLSNPSQDRPINVQPGANKDITVRYSPSGNNIDSAILTISSNAVNTDELEIQMSGSGVYVPQIEVDKNSLDWFILDNTLIYDEIQLSNNGQSDLDYSFTSESMQIPWLSLSHSEGLIAVGQSQNIIITVDTRDIDYGTYFGYLRINSNDPDNSQISIPVTLNHSNFNFTETDNAGNDFVEQADNDLGVAINENYANAPVEFFIYTNEEAIDYAKLRIRVYDIDTNEVNYVFVNGSWVGQLIGSSNNYSITEFMIDPQLINLGNNVANEIEISLDVNGNDTGTSKVMWGQFVFNQEPIYASINSLTLDRTSFYPGEEIEVTALLTTQLYNHEVRALYELYSVDNTLVDSYEENYDLSVTSNYQASASLQFPTDSQLGDYSVKLSIYDEDSNILQGQRTTSLTMMSGDPVISINDQLNFGQTYIGYAKVKNIQVTNQGYAPLTISSISSSNPVFSVVNRAFVLQNGESESITVTYDSSQEGQQTGDLIIESNDPDNQEVSVSLIASSIAPPEIAISVEQITSSIPRFATDSVEFDISNLGNSDLIISSISANGVAWLEISESSMTITAGNSETLTIELSSFDMTEGNYNAIIEIESNDPEHLTSLVNVNMIVTERLITANFSATPLTGPKNLSVSFTSLAQTSDDSEITQYLWDFQNDGIIDSNEVNPEFIYENRGIYSVKLTVINENSESHSLLRENYISIVNTQPELIASLPDIVMDEDSINEEIDIRNYFADADNDNLNYSISGNDHIYVSIINGIVRISPEQDWVGIEEITFTASDNYQGQVSDQITVTVIDVADAPYFIDLPEELTLLQTTRQVIDFSNHVYDPEQSLSLLTLTIENNVHINYNILGLEVTLFAPVDWVGSEIITVNVNDGSGRLVTSQDINIIITDSFTAEFVADNTEVLSGQSVQFTDLTQGNPNHWTWYLDNDDVADSYEQNPSINYNIGGDYSISLVVSYIDENDLVVASDSVRYVDYINVQGTSIPGGNYFGSWEVAFSPYNVYGQVSVETGTTLTIEEGSVINIMEDTGFVVNGGLIADGVIFNTVTNDERQTSEWEGLKFNSASVNSSLTNSSIKNARKAIEINGASPNLSSLNIEGANSQYSAIKIMGSSQAIIEDIDIDKYDTGIEILGDSSSDVPVLTNIRVRHTTNTSRNEAEMRALKIQNSNVLLDDIDIEDFDYGIEIKSDQGNTSPVLTNIRVRHATNTSRNEDAFALRIEGNSSPNISQVEIDDFSKAIIFDALNSSPTPVLTNIRVRHTTNTSRELADTALEFVGQIDVEIDSLEVENYLTGLYFNNSDRVETSTPTLTNIRVRHTTNTSRTDALALRVIGNVNLNLNNFVAENVYDGIQYDASDSLTPTLTNIRVRHTTNTSRTIGGTALAFNGNVSPNLNDVEIEDYLTGLDFDNENRNSETSPVLTNIRVRHTTNTSRESAVALSSRGDVDLIVYDFESENIDQGISIYSSASSAPVLTNIRVRHTTNTSRLPSTKAIYLSGMVVASLDSVLVEDFDEGIVIENLNRTDIVRPTLTNIRVRHTTNSTRIGSIALKSIGLVELALSDFESEDVNTGISLYSTDETRPVLTNIRVRHTTNTRDNTVGISLNSLANAWIRNSEIQACGTGIKIIGNNNAEIERNTLIDNLVAFDLSGQECTSQIHHNHVENNLGADSNFLNASDVGQVQILNNNILGFSKIVSGSNASPYLSQNIIWGANIAESDLASGEQMNASFEYNNISMASDIAPGIGNMNSDPLFSDYPSYDLHLSINSTCIDAGNPLLELDPDGSVADLGMNYHHHLCNFNASGRFNTPGIPIYFDNKAEGHDEPTTSILWEFGDGHSTTERHTEHTYAEAGIYTVTLTMTTGSYTDVVTREAFVVTQDDALTAPQNPMLSMTGPSMNLSWQEITASIAGNPVENVQYLIYSSEDPEGVFEYRDNVTSLTWTDVNIALNSQRQFYFILGFVNDGRTSLQEFINTHRYLRRDGKLIKPITSKTNK